MKSTTFKRKVVEAVEAKTAEEHWGAVKKELNDELVAHLVEEKVKTETFAHDDATYTITLVTPDRSTIDDEKLMALLKRKKIVPSKVFDTVRSQVRNDANLTKLIEQGVLKASEVPMTNPVPNPYVRITVK
jgi:hypothetical protein